MFVFFPPELLRLFWNLGCGGVGGGRVETPQRRLKISFGLVLLLTVQASMKEQSAHVDLVVFNTLWRKRTFFFTIRARTITWALYLGFGEVRQNYLAVSHVREKSF